MKLIKIIVEKHADGYVAYQLGLKGVVVGEGDTYAFRTLLANDTRNRRAIMQSSEGAKQDAMPGA
ncbi:MAG: hypothetical protein NVS2B2_38370 [Ktedonobacteraceae bacterium]